MRITSLVTQTEHFRARILERQPLRIRGGGSKDFYGGALEGDVLEVGAYRGIVNYEPTELFITARCGTPLSEIKSALAARHQFLPFEPPCFGGNATVGGILAAGLSGPRRMSAGAVRDYVLGVQLLDGEGRLLKFGGEVMKNVAGYDVSRLVCGSLGTLGLVLEVSFKVLPQPVKELTLRLETDEAEALELMNRWGGLPLPISATCWIEGALTVRLSGAGTAVRAAHDSLGGELLSARVAEAFWNSLREQTHEFFSGPDPLWRLSLPSTTPPVERTGQTLIEWGGAQRWIRPSATARSLHALAKKIGAGATAFRGADRTANVFQPLSPPLLALHRQIKQRFDPHGVFGHGRLFHGL